MPTNPPRKRPRISLGFSGGRGSLIASLIGSPQEQLASAASAKNAEREATAKRSREYARQAKDYSDGNAPYDATIAALKAAMAAETDPELKGILQSYIGSTENTKVTRDVNAKVDAYNTGAISFGELQQSLTAAQSTTSNELLKSGISKALAGARKAENARQLDSLNTQYSDGKLDINAYLNAVHALRSDPSQRDPAELAKFDAAISGAKQNERQLNDQRTYAAWEAGSMDADTALAYFSGRIATASDPKDIANLDKFAGNIRTIVARETAKGNASVGASLKTSAAEAHKQLNDQTKVVETLVSKTDDPVLITELYKGLGNLAASFIPYVGAEAGFFKEQAQSALLQGRLVAAAVVTKKVDEEVKRLQDAITAAKTDKSLSPRAVIARLTSIAETASQLELKGKYGGWTSPEQQKHGEAMRLEAWRQANTVADEQLKALDAARAKSESVVASTLSDASRAFKNDSKSNLADALRSAGVVVKGTDGKETLDPNRFSEWLSESPQTNGLMVFEASHSRGTGQTGVDTASSNQTFDTSRAKYVDNLVTSLTSVTQFQKDATVALNESAFIKSPRDRYSTGGLGNDNLIQGNGAGPLIKQSLALPLVDSRDNTSFAQGEVGGSTTPLPAPDNNRFDAGNVTPAPQAGMYPKGFDPNVAPASRAGVDFGTGIGSFLKGIFGGQAEAAYTPPPTVGGASAGNNALVKNSSPGSFGISGVEQAVPTFKGFNTPVAPAPVGMPDPTTDTGPAAVNPWRWDVPKTESTGGGPSLPGDATGGPYLTQ